jgi:hypothetical protein
MIRRTGVPGGSGLRAAAHRLDEEGSITMISDSTVRVDRHAAFLARLVAAAAFGMVAAAASPALAWGPVAHQEVTAHAIETLPKGIKPFYKAHRLEIPVLSPEGNAPDEGTERRFMVDRLMPFPFADLPRSEKALNDKFGEAASEVGRLPWLIEESYARLVEAFKQGDKEKILTESDVIAGLVTDLHNPLALTENSDGQKTGQHGLWVRFSTRLPEVMQKRIKLSTDAAHLLDDPKEYVFSMVNATYIWLDNLLYDDELARRGKSGYTEIYYESFELRAGELLRGRLGRAAGDVGSYWYTAWTAAGRPELK